MVRSYYFIGIGGIGMSSLAHLLLDRGDRVAGEDSQNSPIVESLKARGANITTEMHGSPIVVYSTAIPVNHPRRVLATQMGLTCLHRSELIKQVMKGKKRILVAGTHGKTSTSALLSHLLDASGFKPSFVIGGAVPSLGHHGRWGNGKHFVAEADESDGSFHTLQGEGAILTNLEQDHLDYWKGKEALYAGFKAFADQIASPELTFWCADDPALSKLGCSGLSYGKGKGVDVRLTSFRQEKRGSLFSFVFRGEEIRDLFLPQLGEYQAMNCMAAFAMALQLGCLTEDLREGLQTFQGVKRRLESKGEVNGISIYDDYAHHPTAIRQMLISLKSVVGQRRVIAVFEPHRFSRTEQMMEEFAQALSLSDVCMVTDIYSAGEESIAEVSGEKLYQSLFLPKEKYYVPRPKLKERLLSFCQPGDVIVIVGAGPITQLGNELMGCM